MKLVDTVLENMMISFSGRVNILDSETKQFVGSLTQSEGVIINASLGKVTGKKALASLLMQDGQEEKFFVVTEPDLVPVSERSFKMDEKAFFRFKNEYLEQYELLNRLKPSENLNFAINSEKLDIYTPLSHDEFDTMKLILKKGLSKDIYNSSDLLEFDVTKALISLRKKGIILVRGMAQKGEV